MTMRWRKLNIGDNLGALFRILGVRFSYRLLSSSEMQFYRYFLIKRKEQKQKQNWFFKIRAVFIFLNPIFLDILNSNKHYS